MSAAESWLGSVHLAATAGMCGLIWFVQLVHYPLFARVGPDGFAAYEAAHQWRTAWVVGPFMAVEGICALIIAWQTRSALAIAGLVLLAVVHASTVFLQVPLHTRLASGWDPDAAARLVSTNWIRTLAWSARLVVAVGLIAGRSG